MQNVSGIGILRCMAWTAIHVDSGMEIRKLHKDNENTRAQFNLRGFYVGVGMDRCRRIQHIIKYHITRESSKFQ